MVLLIVKTASIDTSSSDRDKHLRSPDFFDADKYPVITFQTKTIASKGAAYDADGDLMMHGVTKHLNFPFEGTRVVDNWGNTRLGIKASFDLTRRDFGIGVSGSSWWNEPVTAGNLLVSDTVHVDVRIQAVLWNVDRITSGPESFSTVLFKTFQETGFPETLKQYNDLIKNQEVDRFQVVEDEFGILGSKLMHVARIDEAIQVFELGIKRFPKSAYLQTKLGDAYRKKGDVELSASSYKKALDLDPYNPKATLMLKRLSKRKST